MRLLCQLFGKSWQAYYQHRDTLSKQRLTEEIVVQFVKEVRRIDPGIGGEKLHHMYRERFGSNCEYMVGRDKMEAIISANNLNVRKKKKTSSYNGLNAWNAHISQSCQGFDT